MSQPGNAGILDRACGSCGRAQPGMVEMLPGRDGQRWHLCGSCYGTPAPRRSATPSPTPARPVTRSSAQRELLT